MKKWELALLLGLVLAVFCAQFTTFAQSCDAVRGDTLRLHILANSDDEADQGCKLAVRDALLASYGGQLAQA
ncbi:MAG: stage II sporulation protein R, partial [Ruthenibacterium sp.]